MCNRQILILVKNLTSGGAEKQSVQLARALSDIYDVHYVILNAKFQEPKYLKILRNEEKIRLVAFEGGIVGRLTHFYQYLVNNNIDLIFSYLTGANLFAVVIGKLAKVEHIFTGIRNAYLPPVKCYIDRLLCNKFVSGAILNCKSGEDYFVKRGFKPNKIRVIPNCFDNIADYKEKRNINDKIKVITVGRFVQQKDYFTALEVICKITKEQPNIIYQIVGYGELEAKIRKRIVELNIESFVEIYINPLNIPDLLDNADIYLSTSLFEGTSNSIMEAINADLPIVATNVGDNYELVRNGLTGFLTRVGDIQEICAHLKSLIVDKNLRLEMGKRGKLYLQENYSIDMFRNRYLDLIEERS